MAEDGEQSSGGVDDSRRSSPRNKRRGERALGREMRLPGTWVASWRPSGDVGADRQGRRQRTTATGRPRIGRPTTDETESCDSVAVGSD